MIKKENEKKLTPAKSNEELVKELIHLKSMRKNEDDKCPMCKAKRKYSEKYDAYYCPKCLYWLEKICSDRECQYCKDRPKYPKEKQE